MVEARKAPEWSRRWTAEGGRAVFVTPARPGQQDPSSRQVPQVPECSPGTKGEWQGWPMVERPPPRRSNARIGKWLVVLALSSAALLLWPYLGSWTDSGPEPSTWAYENTGLSAAQDSGLTGKGVLICQVDTGIELDHPVFKGMSITGWADLVNDMPQPYDDHGHGTAMASLLAGQGDWIGAAPEATFLVIKAIGSDGQGDDSTIAQAVNTCVDNEADVIALSLGGGSLSFIKDVSARAVRDALLKGVFVVAAAGNDGEADDGHVASPSSVPRAISVGAVDRTGQVGPFSSMGRGTQDDPHRKPELVAPGVNLTAAGLQGRYVLISGTSAAVPIVAGALALYLEAHPEYQREGAEGGNGDTIDTVKRQLIESARKIGPLGPAPYGHDVHYGYGLIDIEAALEANAGPNATTG